MQQRRRVQRSRPPPRGGSMSDQTPGPETRPTPDPDRRAADRVAPVHRDRSHWLYLGVLVAVGLGILVGLIAPGVGKNLKPLGDGFIALIRMMISPIIFCTIVLGIGSIRSAARVGRVGGLALGYFLVMSTVALIIGLVIGNLIHPGEGLHLTESLSGLGAKQAAAEPTSTTGFLLSIIPTTLLSAFTDGSVLQTLLVALLVGFAVQLMGSAGAPILRGIGHFQRLVFRVLGMIMWVAPIGAFGAIAAVVGTSGSTALKSLLVIMLGFYLTCIVFVGIILAGILWIISRVSAASLFRYLGREFLLILSTSSSETALPRLIAKMEHLGVSRAVVGITVPTGYSFNLDGTAIYLTMASLFVADALDQPMSLGQQISLLLFMIVASKGAAGVTGAGLATLAGGLQAHRPELLDGVGLIVGIDRFMSEARSLTNFAGNAVATVVVGTWTGEFDRQRADRVLAGEDPFDESTMLSDHGEEPVPPEPAASAPPTAAAAAARE
jgi:aerobic C4-dicarboxylate transport protein